MTGSATRARAVGWTLIAALSVLAGVRFASLRRFDNQIDLRDIVWLPAQSVLQGRDPYRAFLDHAPPVVPRQFWDGAGSGRLPLRDERPEGIPTNTAPLLALAVAFGKLSWPMAARAWSIVSAVAAVVAATCATRLVGARVRSRHGAAIVAFMLASNATRDALVLGQTTLVVVACMFGALLVHASSPIVVGLLLGVALSKYSVALPVCALLLWRRAHTTLAVAAATQLAGIVWISAIGRQSPTRVVAEYLGILRNQADVVSISLPSGLLRDLAAPARAAICAAVVLATASGLMRCRRLLALPGARSTRDLLVLATLFSLNVLVVPHQHAHAFAVEILLVAIVGVDVLGADRAAWSSRARRLSACALAACVALWLFPYGGRALQGRAIYVAMPASAALALSIGLLWELQLRVHGDARVRLPRAPHDDWSRSSVEKYASPT